MVSPPQPNTLIVNSDESISFKLQTDDIVLDEDAIYWGINDGGSYIDLNVPQGEQSTYHTPVLEVTPKEGLTGSDKIIIITSIYAPNLEGLQTHLVLQLE